MQADFRPARRAWLIVIALGHVAVLMAWRPIARHAADATTRADGVLMLLDLPPAPVLPEPAQHARQNSAPRPAQPPVASEESPQSITLPANISVPDDPFAKPTEPAETMRDKARKSAAGIDRQLRKESLNKFATIVNEDTALGLAISGGPATKLSEPESYMGANGVIHKRSMLRGKIVCEEVDHIGVGGRDPFRSGSTARYVRCPK